MEPQTETSVDDGSFKTPTTSVLGLQIRYLYFCFQFRQDVVMYVYHFEISFYTNNEDYIEKDKSQALVFLMCPIWLPLFSILL
jgi:hypothetical protein